MFLHVVGLAAVFAPFVICLLGGALRSSLWLDEITYWYYERSPALRAVEVGRPGSALAPLFTNFFYCDIARLIHAVLNGLGLTLRRDPELFLRFPSLLAYVAAAIFLYFFTFKRSRSWWWSVTASLAFSAAPIFLFYAFEARVYIFSVLVVFVYLALFDAVLGKPPTRRLLVAGALLGVFLAHLHVWVVCLFLGICVAAAIRFLFFRDQGRLPLVAALAIPGGLAAAVETGVILLTGPKGGSRFPLYQPLPMWAARARTIGGSFFPWMSRPSSALKPIPSWPSLPEMALLVAAALVIVSVWRCPRVILAIAAVLALWISVLIGTHVGFLVAPRYQVPLFGALFFSLSLARARSVRLWIGVLAALELVILPSAIIDIGGKSNGKAIAAVIGAETPRKGTAVIVQHGLRLGYPDPLHSFVLHFYLDEIHPDQIPVHIFELPSLRDVTGEEGLSGYFGGGPVLRKRYAATPTSSWEEWLRTCPYDRLWFVFPEPAIGIEKQQVDAFGPALAAGGFAVDRRHEFVFGGYPTSRMVLLRRASARPAPHV